jgi:signal transduction histidine kinase
VSVLDVPGGGQNLHGVESWFDGEQGYPPLTDVFQELRHDAMQSISAILMVVAAGKGEIEDRELVRRRLDQVGGLTRALAGLIDEAVARTADPTAVDVSTQASQTVRALAAGYPGTVRLVAGAGAWAALSPASLSRVLTNLLTNAMRAAGEAGVVQVKVTRIGGRVVVEVEDDGPGFGRLAVVHGIGLRSTRRLVRTAGGTIDFGTGAMGGAAVRVNLPGARDLKGGSCEDPAV